MNLLNVENVSKTYMEKTVLDDVSVGINDNDKIGVVGTNGTGKSTLLGIVAGVISPDSGQVVQGNTLRISYLPQNPSFDMNKTLLENITDTIYAGGEQWDKMGEIKANLAKFGIDDPECDPSILSCQGQSASQRPHAGQRTSLCPQSACSPRQRRHPSLPFRHIHPCLCCSLSASPLQV